MTRFSVLTTGLVLAVLLFSGPGAGPVRAQITMPCDLDIGNVNDQTIYSGEEFLSFTVEAPLIGEGCPSTWAATITVESMGDLTTTVVGANPCDVTVTYPEGWIGAETITFIAEYEESTEETTATFTVLPPLDADICGHIMTADGFAGGGVIVKLIDDDNNQVGEPAVTSNQGDYFFSDIPEGIYSVGIVTPLSFDVLPSETQHDIEPANPCISTDFTLVPTVVSNNCRTVGYWKHQFDVYVSGHGAANETETDLETYLDIVYNHFEILGVYTGLEALTFEDAKNVLMVRGDQPIVDGARQQLFGLLLNFASTRIGNTTVVTADGRTAADAVTLAARLIKNGDEDDHAKAKTVCETINKGQLIESGLVPVGGMVYKWLTNDSGPVKLQLLQNFPNPFNPMSEICFSLPHACRVKMEVFNIAGQRVTTLVNREMEAGYHAVTFDGTKMASGVYMYRLTAGDFVESKKMMLVK